jgi:protein involved in polysaccharide export with SLBB domain
MRSERESRRGRRILGILAGAILVLVPLVNGCSSNVAAPELAAEDIPRFVMAGNFPDHIYRMEPGDTLQIRYTYHPDMNQEIVVLPDGKISAQLVGEIPVSGMTTRELEQLLVQKTSENLRDPEVVVSVSKFAERTVYIGGEVEKPGTIPYRKGLRPLQAIISAGGFRETARPDSVILVRTGGSETQFISRKLNLTDSTGGLEEPLVLAPHDVIFVPRSSIAEANLWVKQHITELIPFFKGSAGVTYRTGP